MRRNKLYTVNRWNKPSFMPEKNLYSLGDKLNKIGDKIGGLFGGDKLMKEGNPTLAGSLVSAGAGLVGGLANNAISGGLSSGAGSAISGLGSTIGSAIGSVNPILGAGISIGSQVLGGVTNALWGESVDEKALAEANAGTAALNSFTSNASTFDEVKGPEAVANVKDVYEGGLFNDVSDKNEELRRQRAEAKAFASRSITNNVNNLVSDQNSNLLRNFSAYGGLLGRRFDGGGEIENTGTPADASWHENWLTNRQEQFDENYEGATEAEKQRFAENHTSTVPDQLDNLRNTVEYSDLKSFERALPESEEHFSPAFTEGAVRSAGDHNALWSIGKSGYGHDTTQHERTHALSPVFEDLEYYTGIENPQDSKINRIINKYGDNLYYTGDDYVRHDGTVHREYKPDEYLDTPEEIYAELNEFRKRAGLSPDYKVTREDIQKWRDSLEDRDSLNVTLKRFNDDALLEFFNDVAYNPTDSTDFDNNMAAFGGPLGFGLGALGIMQQDKYFNTIDNRSAALAGKQHVGGLQTAQQSFAFGGELGTNGTDWTNGLLYIDNGGSHEENPLEGVPMGFDPEGVPNLVEEGETIWNDYVFSDRIKVPKKLMKELGLGGSIGKDITFAEASKKLGKESEQRPNDPISLSGLNAAMSRLAEVQEAERMKNQMKKFVGLAGYACGGKVHRYDDGSTVVKQDNGLIDFDQSVFGLPEVVVTPQRPTSDMSLLDVLSVMDASKGRELSTPSYAPVVSTIDRVKQIENERQQQAIANYIAEKEEENMRRRLGAGYYACGGKKYSGEENHSQAMNRPYNWDDFWKRIADYKGSMKAGNVNGNYAPDAQFNLGKYNSIQDYENSPEYQEFTNRMQEGIRSLKGLGWKIADNSKPESIDNIILSNGNKPTEDQYNVLKYVQYAANRTPDSANTGFFKDPKKNNGYYYFIDNADKQLDRFRNDHKAGVFHLIPSYVAQEQVTTTQDPYRSGPPREATVPHSTIPSVGAEQQAKGYVAAASGTTNEEALAQMGTRAAQESSKTDKGNDTKQKTYYTGLRYAPAIGAGVMTLTDALGLTNKPDYTMADALQAAANSAAVSPNVTYNPIGDYLTYRPMDIWYEQNRLNANSRATDRAILNSGANQGSKMAGLLASGYNDQIASGNLYRQALEYNDAKRKDVADFNRRTNMFNSQMGLEAAMANAKYQQQARQMGLSGLAQAAALRDSIDARVGAARAANLSNFLNSLGDIGRENFVMNQLNTDKSRRYTTDASGRQGYKESHACGGNMKRRKK